MAEQRQRFLEDQVGLKEKNKKLKESVSALENQLQNIHDKMMNLDRSASELEKEFVQLKEGPPISKANKQKIIDEYKMSPELTKAVLGQFDKGY